MKPSGAAIKLTLALVLAIGGVLASRFLPLAEWLKLFEDSMQYLGIWAPVLYILIFGVGVALLGPFSIFAIGAGFCFGPLEGGAVCWAGGMLGSIISFYLSRSILRGSVAELVAKRPFFRSLDTALAGTRAGWMIFLLRLSPAIPYSLSNYLYGATAIRFAPYVWGSALGDLPIAFAWAYIGVAGKLGVEQVSGAGSQHTPLQLALLGVGLVATVAVSIMLMSISKKVLKEQGVETAKATLVEPDPAAITS